MKDNTMFLKNCISEAFFELLKGNSFEELTISEICYKAGVGRSTFYRYFTGSSIKKDILKSKLMHDWEKYEEIHRAEISENKNIGLTQYIYENKELFGMLYQQNLEDIILSFFEHIMIGSEAQSKGQSYILHYLSYGYYGIIIKWIRTGFEENPEDLRNMIYAVVNGQKDR